MIKFFKYLRARSKSSIRFLPLLLCFTLVMSASMLFLLGSLLDSESSSEKNIKLKIGLTGDIEGTYLGMGITAVKEFDSSRFYVDFLPMEAEEAQKALDKGELVGYVSVPDGFVGEVIHGQNPRLAYIEGNNPSALGPLLTREVINIVSALVLESRAGVYAMSDLSYENGVDGSVVRKGEEELNLRYFDAIFSREDSYELNIMGTGRGLGFADYYSLAFMLILMLLWGITCAPLLGTRNMELSRLLYGTGTGITSQVIAEYIPFFIMIAINTAVLTFGIGFVKGTDYLFSGMAGLVYLLPCAAVITSMQFFLYEITDNVISSVLLQMVTALGIAYISGLIYPSGSLPKAVFAIGSVTPVGVCFDYMSQIFLRDPGFGELLPLILYTAVFIPASVVVRRAKIRRLAL